MLCALCLLRAVPFPLIASYQDEHELLDRRLLLGHQLLQLSFLTPKQTLLSPFTLHVFIMHGTLDTD